MFKNILQNIKPKEFKDNYQNFFQNHQTLQATLLTLGDYQFLLLQLGAIYTAKKIYDILPSFRQTFKYDLEKRYGSESWAVITGGDEQMGREISIELAKMKFNICLVGTNSNKMDKICEELFKKYSIQTKIIVVDLISAIDEKFYEKIKKDLLDLDVSILVNGFKSQDEEMKNGANLLLMPIVSVSMTTIFVSKLIIETHFLKRTNHSAIITLINAQPSYSIWQAVRTQQSFFTKSLEQEYSQQRKIDFLTAMPLKHTKDTAYYIIKHLKQGFTESTGTFTNFGR